MRLPSSRGAWLIMIAAITGSAAVSCRHDDGPAYVPASTDVAAKVYISYEDAKPVLDAFHESLPDALRTADVATAWPAWVRTHDADVRARLARGDEDSVVNFWMFGSSFTTRPRATARDLEPLGGRAGAAEVLLGRLDDLIAAMAAPGSNDRLQFARQVLARHGIDPSIPAGREQARTYLIDLHERVIADNDRYRVAAESAARARDEPSRRAAFAKVFSDRGLSSDTSLPIDFALDETLASAKAKGRLTAGIRRVAIIGPGLDFTDKADGYDFYPQQTIQPFALIDSLVRLDLTAAADVRMTTFDLSPRVNSHLDAAHERARGGEPYILQLPVATNDRAHEWEAALLSYWRRLGNAIGDVAPGLAPPSGPTHIEVRAVRVRPAVVLAITARDLNVVLERPASVADAGRFDLIIATNVLVYYDAFEQALALHNVSNMLRPGGFFVTNYAVSQSSPLEAVPDLTTTTYWDRQRNFDTLFWYQRR